MAGPPSPIADVRVALRRSLADVSAGALVAVACSGGPDSLALAAALAFEAPRHGWRHALFTVDHGLQEGSAERANATREWARGRGFDPATVRPVTVGTDGGPEAAARSARYAALDAEADRWGADTVLLGHTRDDQAETVLLAMARGAGPRALAGMAERRGHYRRPLLDVSRETTVAACLADGLTPWADPHNADPRFARSRLRMLMPDVEKAVGPGAIAALARTAARVRDDLDFLESLAGELFETVLGADGSLDAEALRSAPRSLRSRVLHRFARSLGVPAGALSAKHVDALDALVTRWSGQGPAFLPASIAVERDAGRLRPVRRTSDPHGSLSR
jgi:tRNA(Ile)-lysidine synthase